ncbi:MAG: hypothetical protein ACTSW4_00155 [Candidatus Ranarchaeia archaeon]
MSAYEPVINQLLQKNEQISAICILDAGGNVLHTVNEWQVNGPELLKNIADKKPAVEIQGIKYSTIQVDEVRLVASNRQNQGHVVASKIGDKGWLVAYVTPQGDMQGAYLHVAQAANQLSKSM